jgi:peroxisomal membrane protein 4
MEGKFKIIHQSLAEKFKFICQATFQHSKNLAFFVTIYKSLLLLQKKFKGKEGKMDALIAGIFGGYIVFGEDNAINQQVDAS